MPWCLGAWARFTRIEEPPSAPDWPGASGGRAVIGAGMVLRLA